MAGEIRIDWLVKVKDQATKVMKKIETATKGVRSGISRAAFAMKGFKKSIGSGFNKIVELAKSKLVAFALAYLGFSAVRAAIQNFKEFEKALLEITTILPEGIELTDELKTSLQDLSLQFGVDQSKQAKAYYQVISAGITDTAEATKLLTTANKLAVGGIADLQGSITLLASIMNTYGRNGLKAVDASDILFTTVRKGVTTIEQLQSSMGQILAPASALGVSFRDLNATLAVLTTRGDSTSRNVTQLAALFTALTKKQETARAVLGSNARLFSLQALRTKGLAKFLRDLNKVLDGSQEKWIKLLGRAEAALAVTKLASDNFEGLEKTMGEFNNTTGATERAFNILKESLDFKLNVLSQEWKRFATDLTEVVLPAILSITRALADMARDARDTAKGVGDIVNAIFGDIKEADLVESRIRNLKGVLRDLEKDKKRVEKSNFWKFLKPPLSEIKEDIKRVKAELLKLYNLKPKPAPGLSQELLRPEQIIPPEAGPTMQIAFQDAWDELNVGNISGAIQIGAIGFERGIKRAYKGAQRFIDDAQEGRNQARAVAGVITSAMKSGDVKGAFVALLNKSGNIWLQALGAIIDIFGVAEKEFQKRVRSGIAMGRELPKMMIQNIAFFIEELLKELPALIDASMEAIPMIIERLSEMLSKESFWRSVVKALGSFITHGLINPKFWKALYRSIQGGIFEGVVNGVKHFFSEIAKGIGPLFSNLGGVFEGLIKAVKDLISKMSGFGAIQKVAGGGGFSLKDLSPFERGGVVEKLQRAQQGTIIGGNFETGDRTLIRANKGEMVLSKEQQGSLFEMINQGGGAPEQIVVNLQVGKDQLAETILSLSQDGYRLTA